MRNVDFSILKGKVIKEIIGLRPDSEEIRFITTDGYKYIMFHRQDCCESVSVDDVVGDAECLLNTPIQIAEERVSSDEPPSVSKWVDFSYTWTFYTLATVKGYVDIKWFGTSNGYYSESVDFIELEPQCSYN